jgi:hypothetical protein
MPLTFLGFAYRQSHNNKYFEQNDALLPTKGYNKGVYCCEKLLTYMGNAHG